MDIALEAHEFLRQGEDVLFEPLQTAVCGYVLGAPERPYGLVERVGEVVPG